jgi:uncharacterized membrane protein YeaQ/YmgE (transglycosylase-associated protein family)
LLDRILERRVGMGVRGWMIFGLLAGLVTMFLLFLMPGRDPGGFLVTTLLGIVGAVVGGYPGRAIG